MQRALLAIVRAVEDMRDDQAGSGRRGILVLDEPTVYLPKNEINQLFELVRSIVAEGSSIIFVSHDLDEALEITDRITVLRDGKVVGTVASNDTTPARLVEMIIGRTLESVHATEDVVSTKPVRAAVSGLAGGLLNGVSFDAHEGEVLGLTGLAGSGFEMVPYFLYGARTAVAGELTHAGRTHDLTKVTPADSLAHDIALFPADRLEDGCVGSLPVSENLALPILGSYFENLRLDRRRMIKDADGLLERYDVRPRKPRMAYGQLSGGNQQKAMMARGLRTHPTLLLLHEPTQGVDIGARQNIFELIRAAATEDATVICASSDYEQLALICDRVLIFAGGEVVASLVGNEITKDRILQQCFRAAVGARDDG